MPRIQAREWDYDAVIAFVTNKIKNIVINDELETLTLSDVYKACVATLEPSKQKTKAHMTIQRICNDCREPEFRALHDFYKKWYSGTRTEEEKVNGAKCRDLVIKKLKKNPDFGITLALRMVLSENEELRLSQARTSKTYTKLPDDDLLKLTPISVVAIYKYLGDNYPALLEIIQQENELATHRLSPLFSSTGQRALALWQAGLATNNNEAGEILYSLGFKPKLSKGRSIPLTVSSYRVYVSQSGYWEELTAEEYDQMPAERWAKSSYYENISAAKMRTELVRRAAILGITYEQLANALEITDPDSAEYAEMTTAYDEFEAKHEHHPMKRPPLVCEVQSSHALPTQGIGDNAIIELSD